MDAGIPSEIKVLQPMKLDQDYQALVESVCQAYSLGSDLLMSLDISQLYRESHGLIGLTVRIIQWLYLQRGAIARASRSKVYQQLLVENERDEDFEDGAGDGPPVSNE